ncbi:lytic transglycosylase domain-containing protein [Compostimonas suwonensis]|uniref:Membrane-bound lytic murein transglycosylase B n=1 Tax=Compostimonas suwonensis TaxID=1048394 RepID=A0A2M9C046_9MICO|nr:lytic murein transglycosylase [Compostimonas suwonensis]PJJ63706.1 membrane-bound lytic murein transglycosylase B [Compostimonas suwonensis]
MSATRRSLVIAAFVLGAGLLVWLGNLWLDSGRDAPGFMVPGAAQSVPNPDGSVGLQQPLLQPQLQPASDAAAAAEGGVRTLGPAIAQLAAPEWVARVSAATGIPQRAVQAYAGASLQLATEQPDCRIGWTTLAGIGDIESGHGTHDGASIDASGRAVPEILGPVLDGGDTAAIADSDGGSWDGDTAWDRAVGPLQFIPSTWAQWGADGNGDGVDDPHQIDDAALAAGRYLCHGGDMSTADGWRGAVFSYNHLDSYVDSIAAMANEYARLAQG